MKKNTKKYILFNDYTINRAETKHNEITSASEREFWLHFSFDEQSNNTVLHFDKKQN